MFNAEEQVKRLFISTDNSDWDTLNEIFNEEVELDYHSMNGIPSTVLNKKEIIASWKGLLLGFDHTHHQIGNTVSKENDNEATVYTYGTAHHYLEDAGDLWVVVGSYDFNLKKENNNWKVTTMKFNYKFQYGNSNLIEKAMNNVKEK